MQTRVSRICDAIIEAGWLAALIVTPLFFNTYTNRVFEPDKLHILRSIALVMAVAWIVQLLDIRFQPDSHRADSDATPRAGVWTRLRGTPLVLPTLLLIVTYLISTALSLVPRISLVGSYVRLQGTFTFLSYVAIFAMVLTHLRTRVQVNRIFHTVILTSIPISIYGLIQHSGLDPLPWGGNVQQRVAGNMGNAIFVAAYLIMAFFLTLERLVDSVTAVLSSERGSTADALRAGAYLFILAIQVLTIVYTLSRGPWLGLAVGLYIFGLLGALLLGRWAVGRPRIPRWLGQAIRPAWLGLIGLSVVILAFLVVLNIPTGPLKALRQQRYIGRMSTIFNISESTNAVRVLIWEGTVDMMLKPHAPLQFPDGTQDTLNAIRPLVGYGPESMWVAYNRFYPPDLAHVEQRNASPDRSHNETFDAIVRTGLLGLAAQLFLFGSIFYFALRWLGLIRGRGRRNLFLGMLIGSAALGVIIPLVLDHSFRLAGIGLPAGLIFGTIAYATIDVLFTPATAAGMAAVNDDDKRQTSPERQLLILAIFAAIVAHIVEIHIGIAIASTLTHFWVLAGVLVVAGMGWLDEEKAVETVPAPTTTRADTGARAVPAVGAQKSGKNRRTTSGRTAPSQRPYAAAASSAGGSRLLAPQAISPVREFLPYAGVVALVTLVLTWDYLINQTGAKSAFGILWDAFTARVDQTSKAVVPAPMLMVMLLFTWVVGGLLAMTEHYRLRDHDRQYRWGANAGVYAGTAVGVFLIYGLLQASRSILTGLNGMEVFDRIAGHIVFFDGVLFVLMVGLAFAIGRANTRPRPLGWFGGVPALPIMGGLVTAVVALLIIANTNIRIIQADTYYKQGLAYEGVNQWESAIILYNQAAHLEPQEDYYYLFLGRALLEYSSGAPAGTGTLPADVTAVPTDQLLSLVDRGLQANTREDLLRAANAVLTGAQRLNPLNTDHSANLARLYRSWAFVDALKSSDVPSNQMLRQLVSTQAKGVDVQKVQQSLAYYKVATSLSPQNAQLLNEMAAVQYILGDTQAALASLDRSASLDQQYTQTFLLMADMKAEAGDKKGALDAYRQADKLNPGDTQVLGAIGVYSAQTGDIEGALTAFGDVISQEGKALADAQQQLVALDARVNQAGGYDKAGQAATSQRDTLQNSVTTHKSQIHLAYRNEALVLRDAGRKSDALAAARSALDYATTDQRAQIEQLVAELQK